MAGNILSLGGGEILSRLIAFVGTAYLARKLEPAGFGVVSFAAAIFGYFQFATAAGFHDVGAREVARRPRAAPAIAASVILVRLALSVAALAVLSVVAWSLDKPPAVKLVVVLTGLSLFSLAVNTSWVYKGLERGRPVGLAMMLGQALYVGIILLFIHSPEDVTRPPLAQFCGELGASLLLAVPLFRCQYIKLDLREGWAIFRASWFAAITRLLRTLIFTFDVVLLGLLLGDKAVGLYAAPYRVCFLLLSVAAAIQESYLPAVSRTAIRGVNEVAVISGRSIYLAAAVGAPMVVGGAVLAAPLLGTAFGASYLEGATAFRLLLVSACCAFIYGAIHNVLVAFDRLRVELWIIVASAGLNVTLNFVAIPRYGLVGAGAALALTEAVVVLLGLWAVYRLNVPLNFWPVWRPLLAAGVMGGCLIALGRGQALVLSLAVGSVTYVSLLVLLRGIPHELSLLRQTVKTGT